MFLKIQISDETTDGSTSHLTDKATSHFTRLSKVDNQVTGYNPSKDAGQVIGYSHSTRPPKNGSQVAGYKPDKACEKNRRAAYGVYASKIFRAQRSMATKLWILRSAR